MNGLTCPKCGQPWRSFERNGITVDQCTGCRGVFLDRGELERLIEVESQYAEGRSYGRAEELGYADRYRERYPMPFRHDDDDDDDRRHESRHASEHRPQYGSEHGARHDQYSSGGLGSVVGEVLKQVGGQKHCGYGQQHSGHRPRKKESFLGDLFG